MESMRSSQRRQGSTVEASPQPTSMMDQPSQASIGSQSRNVSGTGPRTHGSRSSNPDKQISQIEKSVTHLLVATKQLLETLTQWSRGNAQEEEVSDVYVRLGYEFNLACRAFNSIGVDTTDLGPVPDLLRTILEDTLSQPASPQALDNYLPRIRDIIINLLQGLKKKQSKLRSRPTKEGAAQSSKGAVQQPGRQSSTTSVMSNDATASLPQYNDGRRESPSVPDLDELTAEPVASLPMIDRNSLRRSIRREPQKQIPSSDSSSTVSGSLPVLSPPQQEPAQDSVTFPHPPPPPPKQDALTALQRGGDLERRASRRFSAFQIQKHLGASPNGVPVIPPAQNSPIPNRGREARESMRAVTSRTTYQSGRQKSGSKLNDTSPSRIGTRPERITEEQEEPNTLQTDLTNADIPKAAATSDSPTAKTPDEFHVPKQDVISTSHPEVGATVGEPFSPSKEVPAFTPVDQTNQVDNIPSKREVVHQSAIRDLATPETTKIPTSTTPPPAPIIDLDSSPASTKELTLFLQYKTRIKKFVLSGGYEDLSLARLQLAFIEKFVWNTHNNGVDLPEIYIQDPVSGVRHELEDLSDVKDRSVLVLNFEVLDEVKKHFDEGIGGLRSTLDNVKTILDGQGTLMQRFADRQLEASKEMARLSAAPTPRATRASTMEFDASKPGFVLLPGPASEASLAEVQNLRRDIAVLKQTYSAMSADFSASMTSIKAKAAHVKEAAVVVTEPTYEGASGRAHVNEGKKKLQTESEALVNRVDNLSDTVEDLRKDVVTRGVRPRPADLERLSKEISGTVKALATMKEFMKREKPTWTKVWENELNQVCVEREELSQQEELMADLYGDLEDVQNVFNLVEEAMKQQNLQGGTGSLRQVSKAVEIDPTIDPSQVKEGVLDEVRALRPNHENRLEAIERAEAARKKELESRQGNEFQKEVAEFVEEGKLKRTGGMDEVERIREQKEKRARQENWETQMRIEEEKARKKAEREAAKAAKAKAAAEARTNGEVTAAVARDEEPAADTGHEPTDAVHDTSQEGESSFHDAATGTTPAATPISEELTSHNVEMPPPVTTNEERDGTEAPQPPEIKSLSKDAATTDAQKETGNSNSWWKPAVF